MGKQKMKLKAVDTLSMVLSNTSHSKSLSQNLIDLVFDYVDHYEKYGNVITLDYGNKKITPRLALDFFHSLESIDGLWELSNSEIAKQMATTMDNLMLKFSTYYHYQHVTGDAVTPQERETLETARLVRDFFLSLNVASGKPKVGGSIKMVHASRNLELGQSLKVGQNIRVANVGNSFELEKELKVNRNINTK